ncbi:MAG: class I SAM-dependent methyltransferase [Deltaproteobacteria bacterium]|nr:class I SAM-dependent methyltransferase [Deltaproteobacteria bacterium]
MDESLVRRTVEHYAEKWERHGASPLGVDWNGESSQVLHFQQLARVLQPGTAFTANDLGCGYGALLDFLEHHGGCAGYRGYDVNESMVAAARERTAGREGVSFEVRSAPDRDADYGFASGIFTLRLGRSDEERMRQMGDTLDELDRTSARGFAFNCLTSYSDAEKMRDYLYYPDPCAVFDRCKRRYSRNLVLLHDYGLFAFTVLVRKDVAVPGAPAR